MNDSIRVRIEDGVGVLMLNRAGAFNAFDLEMATSLADHLRTRMQYLFSAHP